MKMKAMKKNPRKIMVVDDDEEFLDEMSETLSLAGYETRSFTDGTGALGMFEKVRPDVVLLDLKMEKKDGFQTAQEMRRLDGGGDVHIIAMTGYYTEDSHKKLVELCRIDDIMIKPVKPLGAIARIERLIK